MLISTSRKDDLLQRIQGSKGISQPSSSNLSTKHPQREIIFSSLKNKIEHHLNQKKWGSTISEPFLKLPHHTHIGLSLILKGVASAQYSHNPMPHPPRRKTAHQSAVACHYHQRSNLMSSHHAFQTQQTISDIVQSAHCACALSNQQRHLSHNPARPERESDTSSWLKKDTRDDQFGACLLHRRPATKPE